MQAFDLGSKPHAGIMREKPFQVLSECSFQMVDYRGLWFRLSRLCGGWQGKCAEEFGPSVVVRRAGVSQLLFEGTQGSPIALP